MLHRVVFDVALLTGLDHRGAVVLRQRWSRSQVERRFANLRTLPDVGAHHLSRMLKAIGHDARLMLARYVRPYSKGQKNDFRDAEAIAEAVQRRTVKLVANALMVTVNDARLTWDEGFGTESRCSSCS